MTTSMSLKERLPVTYHVVVTFDRDAEGELWANEPQEAVSPAAAERAERQHAGAMAFSRTGEPVTRDFEDAVILARFGDVDLEALSVYTAHVRRRLLFSDKELRHKQ